MTAQTQTAFVEPEPILARALPRPQFDNSHVSNFRLWFAANEKTLVDFFNALAPYVEGEPLEDYFRWVVVVHEVEQLRAAGGDLLPHGDSQS